MNSSSLHINEDADADADAMLNFLFKFSRTEGIQIPHVYM